MKKMLLLCGTLLLVTASVASAGINLAWDACLADGGKTLELRCNSNLNNAANAKHVVGSWVPGASVPQFQAMRALLTVSTGGTALPPYWGDACTGRTSPFAGVGISSVCANDAYMGTVGSGISILQIIPGTGNSRVLDMLSAVPAGSESNLLAGTEYFMFDVQLQNAGTTTTCLGCTTPASLTFSLIRVSSLSGGVSSDTDYTNAETPGSNVCFQTGTPTGTRSATWGSVKALYR